MKFFRLASVLVFAATLIFYNHTIRQREKDTDTTMPQIIAQDFTLELSIHDSEDALLQGLSAWDEKDGDLTSHILVAEKSDFTDAGSFEVSYVVFDSDLHCAQYTRTIHYVDYESPRFSLAAPLVFTANSKIDLLSYISASDSLEGDISRDIELIDSEIDLQTPGIYPIRLQVTNSYGDMAEVELNVCVQAAASYGPVITLSDYLIYVDAGTAFDPVGQITSVVHSDGSVIDPSTVAISGSFNTQIPGCYHLTYSVTYGGRTGSAYLTVVVTK